MTSGNYIYGGEWILKGQHLAEQVEPMWIASGPTAAFQSPPHRPDASTRHTLAAILALTLIVLFVAAV